MMDRPDQTAWQPFTPRGVARFGGASSGRLLVVQLAFALFAAVVVMLCIRATWFPVVQAAIQRLPEQGEVRRGRLRWLETSPQHLAEGRHLSLAVDLEHTGGARGVAHINVELGATSVRVFSLFGYLEVPYPAIGTFALNRAETGPWWGAWSPALLAVVFIGTVVVLVGVWALLALGYCVPVWLAAFWTNRALDLRGAWRLCGAAQMPGAFFLTVAIWLYGLGVLDPVKWLLAFAVHFVVSWVYLAWSPWTLPSVQAAAGGNPFAEGAHPEEGESKKPTRKENPFESAGP